MARICREGLKGGEGSGERFDDVDSEVRRVCEEGGWDGESGVGIFVHVPVESRGFLVTCSVGYLAVRTMDV